MTYNMWYMSHDGTIHNPEETDKLLTREDSTRYENSSELPLDYALYTDSQDIESVIDSNLNSCVWQWIEPNQVTGVFVLQCEWFRIAYAITSSRPYLTNNPIWRIE